MERRRWAKYFSIPIADKVPDGFPIATLGAQRALCALSQKAPERVVPAMEALFHATWIDRNSKIGKPEGFGPVLESVVGKETTQELIPLVSPIPPRFYSSDNHADCVLQRRASHR